MFRWLLLVGVLVAILTGLVVGVLNPAHVELNLLFFSVSLPVGALVSASFFAGILVAWFIQAVARLGRLFVRRPR